jgi:outer membrane protein OmpA-like peptidoglycan-associated protein
MRTYTIKIIALTAALLAFSGPAFADDPESFDGIIVSHDGATIVVRRDGNDVPVTLTDSTRIRGTNGVLGVRGEDHPAADLIRGLAVEVTPTEEGDGAVTAAEVKFKNEDLRTAQQIQAGLAGTEQRIDNVGELVARGRTRVFFATGSARLTAEGMQSLRDIATQAQAITGYRLAVVGRADSTGNAETNRRLSERRVTAVTDYLVQSCGVLPGRILPTTSLGESSVVNDVDPPKNNAEARRVTVTIAVSASAADQTPSGE